MGRMKRMINEMKLRLPAISINEGVFRAVLSAFVAELDPSIEEVCDLRLAVSEAVTNCIVHAYKKEVGKITLTLRICENRVFKMIVADKGCGIADVKEARKPLFTTLPDEDRCGMGFSIMESFSDKLDVKSKLGKGTKVTLTKKLSPADAT
jgi:stage II sporulation protein AB (anti-sigma F factor)